MRHYRYIFWVLFLAVMSGVIFLPEKVYTQTNWQCETIGPEEDYLLKQGITSYSSQLQSVAVRIFIHVIRRSNGSGGLTPQEVSNAIDKMKSDFISREIYFTEIGRDFIDDDNYYNFSGADFYNLIQVNSHTDAIDIYLLPSNILYGRASDIPGIALVLGGGYAGTSVLSHEMGHCLGLWHTHSGRGCNDFANCPEEIDSSNCSSCGDLVCDTPADPCLRGYVNAQCQYVGPPQFTPDVGNIMSYTPPTCMTHFTTGQFDRILTMIDNSPLLQNVIEPTFSVTVDQRLSNGSSIDSVARWVISKFDTFAVPRYFGFTVGFTEIFQGTQKIISNEKYNNWNDLSDVTNHHMFIIDFFTTEIVSNFKSTKSGIVIKNAFLSVPDGTDPDGDVIAFKDPWLIDSIDANHGNNPLNRGMAAVFRTQESPFNPDYTTPHNGYVYQGVFLNQPFTGNNPHYSVRALSEQVIPFHGEDITWYFEGWEGDNVQFQHPNQTETAVVFQADGAEARALYKGHLVSDQNGGMRYVVQRHIAYQNGTWYMMYRDGGRLYVSTSNDGVSWSREKRISGSLQNCDHAHIAAGMQTGYLYVVWERSVGNNQYEVYFTRTTDGGNSWDAPQLIATVSTSSYQAYGPQPVIAEMRTSSDIEPNGVQDSNSTNAPPPQYTYHTVLVYVTSSGLKWHYSRTHGSSWGPQQDIPVPSTTTVWFPSIASGGDFIALAYSFRSNSYEVTTRVFDGSAWSAAADVSGIAGRLYDRQPNIAVTRSGKLLIGWHAHDNSGQYRVLLRRGYSNNTWQSQVEEITPRGTVHEGHPSVNFWNDEDVDVVWFDNNHTIYRRQYSNGFSSYTESILSSNGLHAHLPQLRPGDYATAFVTWTEKTGQPYLIQTTAGVNYTSNKMTPVAMVLEGREAIVAQADLVQRFRLSTVNLDETPVAFEPLPGAMPVMLTVGDVGRYVRTEVFNIDGHGSIGFRAGVENDGGVVDSVAMVGNTVSSRPAVGYAELVNGSGEVIWRQPLINGEKTYHLPVALFPAGTYYLRIQVEQGGADARVGIREMHRLAAPTVVSERSPRSGAALERDTALPQEFDLQPAYPNPFNPSTRIGYALPEASEVALVVYNVHGQRIRELVGGRQPAGWHSVIWDGRNGSGKPVPSGVYVVRMAAHPIRGRGSAFVASRKVVLMK